MTPTAVSKPPPPRRFTTLASVRLATSDTVRRVAIGELAPEQGRVLVDGYRLIADILRETKAGGA